MQSIGSSSGHSTDKKFDSGNYFISRAANLNGRCYHQQLQLTVNCTMNWQGNVICTHQKYYTNFQQEFVNFESSNMTGKGFLFDKNTGDSLPMGHVMTQSVVTVHGPIVSWVDRWCPLRHQGNYHVLVKCCMTINDVSIRHQ